MVQSPWRGIDIDIYPSIRAHLTRFRQQLEPKPKNWTGDHWPGRKPGAYKWYETQDPVDYWPEFACPKIMYQDIAWTPSFCFDNDGRFPNNTVYFIPTADKWLLAVLNSPAAWWLSWRTAQHGKDEALRLFNTFMESFPIPSPSLDRRERSDSAVARLLTISCDQQQIRRQILDWLKVEYEIAKPSTKLQSPTDMDCDSFVAEIRKVRGKKKPLSVAGLAHLRDEYARFIEPARVIAAEALTLEYEISHLVNEAYGLTPEEIALMWQTAPPRMPTRPPSS